MADKTEIKIGGNISGAEASIKDLENMTKKSFSKMSASAEESGEDISKAYKRAGIRTEKAIRQSSANAKRDFEKIKNSGVASANDIKRAHSAMKTKIKKNNAELGISVGKFATAFKKAKGNIVAAAFAIGTAIAAAFTRTAVGEAIGFESALLDLQKVMSDTDGDAKQFTGTVEELSKKFGVSSTEILQGAANFKQAGFSVKEAFDLQENALKLVIAGDLEAAEAAELLVSTLKGFKAPASDAARLTDVLNEVSNKYATNVRELAIGMSEVSPIAKKMGFSFEETAGLLTPIIEVFRSGSESSQAFRTGLLKLLDDSVPVQNALHDLGVSQKDANGQFRSGRDILKDVSTSFLGLEQNQKLVFATQIVGIRQAAKMVEVFDGLAKTTEVTNVAMGAAGSINKEVAIRLAATETKGKRASQSFKIMSKAIGTILLPAWNKFLDVAILTFDVIGKGFVKIGNAIDRLPNFTRFINPLLFLVKNTKKATDETKALVKANDEFEKGEKKIAEALADSAKEFEERKKAREEEAEQVQKNAQLELEALNASSESQKVHNDLIRESIRATKEQLQGLEQELESAKAFTEKIFAEIAKSEKTRVQSGFDPLETLLDDLKRAEDNFRLAAQERAAGNVDRARDLTLSAVQAANAILEVQKGAEKDSEVSTREINKARFEADKLVEAAKKFAVEMQTAAEDAVPVVEQQLATLESSLQQGKETLKGVKSEIEAATQQAELLKTKLSENTVATHTQIINTVNTGGGASIPGLSRGGGLPGFGGGDRRLRLLEDGEHVIRKESVQKLGRAAAEAFNQGDISSLIASLPIQGMKQGGSVQESTNSVNVNLSLDGKTFPMTAENNVADEFVKDIKSINIVKGRKKNPF